MVLGGDLDAAALQVLHRVVGPAVAEGQLEGLEAERPAEELMTEADPPHRPPADQRAQRLHELIERRRIARPVGQEDRLGIVGEQLIGASRAWIQRDARLTRDQVAHDRAFDAGVEHRDPRSRAAAVAADALGSDEPREVLAGHRRLGRDQSARLLFGDGGREDPAGHRARVADVLHERPRVDARDRRHAAVREPVEPAPLGAGGLLAVRGLAHDRPAGPDPLGLHRLGAGPVVADLGVGEGDQLGREGRVAHRLLIARHAGREHDLADGLAASPAGPAFEAGSVREQDVGGGGAHETTEKARSR